jgi:hypothetical protein
LQARRGQEALDLISGLKSQEADVQARRLNAGLKTQGADQIRKLKNRWCVYSAWALSDFSKQAHLDSKILALVKDRLNVLGADSLQVPTAALPEVADAAAASAGTGEPQQGDPVATPSGC